MTTQLTKNISWVKYAGVADRVEQTESIRRAKNWVKTGQIPDDATEELFESEARKVHKYNKYKDSGQLRRALEKSLEKIRLSWRA